MASDVKKFMRERFLAQVDLELMQALFARSFADGQCPVAFDRETPAVREALRAYFDEPITTWSEGMIADLHRIAELGTNDGLQLILNEARRQGVTLYSERERSADGAPTKFEAKHVALHAYLKHPQVFEAAADFLALRAPSAMADTSRTNS